ncbi:hypothetical protein P3X46_001752 [Hevea brasiliensis]|uniref:WAT1-related protein n=1 Tax=Hevea brasiliensis TaxID=3981 RepID=A0ABQ9NFM3_HEVBR|nr:hypothetical protein P3X46_001752 [Hevea brasiliensis]
MSRYVPVVYGFSFGTNYRKMKSKLNGVICLHIFFLGFLRTVGRVMLFAGLQYTSSAFTSAMLNLVPAMTFIVAIFSRIDKLEIAKLISRAKIGGTRVAFGGATVMTLYKGITLISLHGLHAHHSAKSKSFSHRNFVKGFLILVDQCLSMAVFARTIKKYPSPMKLTTLTGVSGTIVATIVAAITDHKVSSWRLSWDMTFVAPLYNKGSVFMTSFRPVTTVFAAIMGLFILGEVVLGATMIILGLYAILWGKEVEKKKKLVDPAISDQDHILNKTQNYNCCYLKFSIKFEV